jgi:hypothetical protein
MGGGDKKDDDKGDAAKPDAAKPADPPATPDAPKPDAPKPAPSLGKKIVLDKIGTWKEGKARGNRPAPLEVPAAEGDSEPAHVLVINVMGKGDFDKELARWIKNWTDKDGKALETSAAKTDSFDISGIKAKTAEFSGTAPAGRGGGKKKGGDDAAPPPAGKPGQKVISALLDGPDGAGSIVVRIVGPEKTIDKNKDDFIKYLKSAHLVDKTAADDKPAPPKGKKGADD